MDDKVCRECGQRIRAPLPLRVIHPNLIDGGWMPDLATAVHVGTIFSRGQRGGFAIVPADYPYTPSDELLRRVGRLP